MLNGKFVFRPTWENRQSTTIPVVNLEELVFTMRTFECHIYYTYDTVTHNILANIGQHKHARSVCDRLLCVLFRKNAREKCPDQTNAVWKLRSFWDLESIWRASSIPFRLMNKGSTCASSNNMNVESFAILQYELLFSICAMQCFTRQSLHKLCCFSSGGEKVAKGTDWHWLSTVSQHDFY